MYKLPDVNTLLAAFLLGVIIGLLTAHVADRNKNPKDGKTTKQAEEALEYLDRGELPCKKEI